MDAKTVCARCGEVAVGRPGACPSCGEDPRVAGRYRLEGVLGRGGGGVTWQARQEPGGRPVCLKELRWATMPGLDDERRFTREGELLRGLSHPAIPEHFGAFTWGEGRHHALFIAQELVVGDNLEAERRNRGYSEREVVEVGVAVAEVLVYLHGLRPPVVHRDLKPSNLMRRVDGRIVVVDFGAARVVGLGDSQVSVAGTFGFMAPEQIRGEAGPAADVYGLGMTLAVMLSGGGPEALLDEDNRPDLGRIAERGGVSQGLRALLEDMVARDPDARPGAAQVVERLRRLGERRPVPVMARAEVEVVARPVPGQRAVAVIRASVIVAAVLAIGGFGLALMLTTAGPPVEPPAPAPAVDAAVSEEHARHLAELERQRAEAAEAREQARRQAEEERLRREADTAVAAAPRCASGEPVACGRLVRGLNGSERAEVLALPGWPEPLRAGCEAGVADACEQMAVVYAQGLGVEESRIETRAWFARACELGQLDGCASYGSMLMKGDGGRPDAAAALVPLDKACVGGDREACLNIGAIYANGQDGVKADRKKALGIFEGLCDGGHRLACENVDAMVGNDWGLPPGAERYATLSRLCDKRVGTACHRLGVAYAAGAGVKRDATRAKDLFTRGCDLGVAESCKRL